MTCQRCQAEASVHLTETIDGRRREVHLCGRCAREAGMAQPPPLPSTALDAVVQSLILANVGELVGELAQKACPVCGVKFMEFRRQGKLGCPNDYRVFDKGLHPLLQRAQGATRHVGKVPSRRPDPMRRLQLRSLLREAVDREDYEEAARLRDQLRQKDSDR